MFFEEQPKLNYLNCIIESVGMYQQYWQQASPIIYKSGGSFLDGFGKKERTGLCGRNHHVSPERQLASQNHPSSNGDNDIFNRRAVVPPPSSHPPHAVIQHYYHQIDVCGNNSKPPAHEPHPQSSALHSSPLVHPSPLHHNNQKVHKGSPSTKQEEYLLRGMVPPPLDAVIVPTDNTTALPVISPPTHSEWPRLPHKNSEDNIISEIGRLRQSSDKLLGGCNVFGTSVEIVKKRQEEVTKIEQREEDEEFRRTMSLLETEQEEEKLRWQHREGSKNQNIKSSSVRRSKKLTSKITNKSSGVEDATGSSSINSESVPLYAHRQRILAEQRELGGKKHLVRDLPSPMRTLEANELQAQLQCLKKGVNHPSTGPSFGVSPSPGVFQAPLALYRGIPESNYVELHSKKPCVSFPVIDVKKAHHISPLLPSKERQVIYRPQPPSTIPMEAAPNPKKPYSLSTALFRAMPSKSFLDALLFQPQQQRPIQQPSILKR